MYNLVSRITDGLGELKKLLETHIHNQGLAAIEKCGEAALNVRQKHGGPPPFWFMLDIPAFFKCGLNGFRQKRMSWGCFESRVDGFYSLETIGQTFMQLYFCFVFYYLFFHP